MTKSMASTPFGKKLIYKINDECIWSEYVAHASSTEGPHTLSFRERAESLLGNIKRGVCTALFLKAS